MIVLELNYAKKIGLPNYSSHSFAVTIRTELSDLSQLEKTNAELYARLQTAVDSQIVNAGHLPGETAPANNRQPASSTPDTAPATIPTNRLAPAATNDSAWACSPKQRDLINKIINESQLDPANIESLAQERFRTGLRQLNKLQASSLIDELIETHGGRQSGNRGDRRPANAGRGRT